MRVNLKVKLVILMLGIIVVANMSLGTIAYKNSNSAMNASVNQTLAVIAEKVANEVHDMNEIELAALRSIAEISLLKDENISLAEKCKILSAVKDVDSSKYENIAYYDANGDSIVGDGRIMNFKGRAYFDDALRGRNVITNPSFSTVNNQILQFYSVPVYNYSRKAIGVVCAVIKGERLTNVVSQIDLGMGNYPAIIDCTTGKAVAEVSVRNEETDFTLIDRNCEFGQIAGKVLNGQSGTAVYFDTTINKKMTASYRPIEGVNWEVFCAAPYIYYFAKLEHLQKALIVSLIGSILLAGILGFVLIRLLLKPLESVKDAITDIGSGNADLTKRLTKATNDEIGDIVDGFNNFTENLQGIVKAVQNSRGTLESAGTDLNNSTADTAASIHQIIANIESIHSQINNQGDSVSQTAGAVNEIASNIESLERMIETQSESVSQASTAVEEMIGNISSVNSSMDKMADSFEKLAVSAKTGANLQTNANDRMELIKDQSETLQEANLAIAAIAEQTNLLAMNAAIEAAHAGEAGKGFSVVADEIRKLSETSSEQSRTIGVQLNNIRESIEEMVVASEKSSEAFHDVTTRITETDELVRQIKSAMEEQTLGSQQITDALHSMNDSTLEVRTASKEMSEGNKAILEEVRNLQNATGVMKDSMSEMSAGATKIMRQVLL